MWGKATNLFCDHEFSNNVLCPAAEMTQLLISQALVISVFMLSVAYKKTKSYIVLHKTNWFKLDF